MRIAFICGAMEPGRDGVGDYVRKLAVELIRRGHECFVIALNDAFVNTDLKGIQNDINTSVNVLRLASGGSQKERLTKLKETLILLRPDWVSLQFVPYSFNAKGLPFDFFKLLSKLGIDAKWHLMAHEIWLDKVERKSQLLIKLAQKFIIFKGVRDLRPHLVNVSMPYNQIRLKQLGINSEVLGLFGNIVKAVKTLPPEKFKEAEKYHKKVLYFGSPPRGQFLEQTVDGLREYCKTENAPVAVILVSDNSHQKDLFVNSLNKNLADFKAKVLDLGFLKADEISTLLSLCSVGIVRSEPYLLGKSGTAVAMLEHGLPIWLPKWKGNNAVEYSFRQDIIFANLKKAADNLNTYQYHSLLPEIAEQFVAQLQKIK